MNSPTLPSYFIILLISLAACDSCNDACYINPLQNQNVSLVAVSDTRWTGVAISKTLTRFACYPNWSDDHSISLVDITDSLHFKSYPNEQWNTWSAELNPAEHFICVQTVYIDNNNFLWILDSANPQRDGLFLGVIKGGAKLVKIDLNTRAVVQTIVFTEPAIKSTSYLNDVRIDEERAMAYITDSNEGAIVVVNLKNGNARRLLSKHPSTQSENDILTVEGETFLNEQGGYPSIDADGIALSPDKTYLYWRPLTGNGLYRIKTEYLLNEVMTERELESTIEDMGSYFPPSDGMIFTPDGLLYLASVEENGIRVARVERRMSTLITKDEDIKWPDSFSLSPDGYLYFTTSQLHNAEPDEPHRLYKLKL